MGFNCEYRYEKGNSGKDMVVFYHNMNDGA